MKHNVFQLFRSYLQAGKEQLKNLKGNPFKKKWLKRLDRYIIVKFLGTYFFAIALIISIAVVFDINENIDDFINNKAPISAIIFDYYLNFIPYYTNLFSPLFVFIAVIFFTSKLAENSEIIAMFSTGMSFKRLMVPYMISAAIIALVTYVLSTEVIPTGSVTRLKFEQVYKNKKRADYVRNIQVSLPTWSATKTTTRRLTASRSTSLKTTSWYRTSRPAVLRTTPPPCTAGLSRTT